MGAKGSNGSSSSSSSPGLRDERRELGVTARGCREWSGINGAAIARLEVALSWLWDHKSGVSALYPERVAGLDEAADWGRGTGLNSVAFALKSRGEEIGDDGRLEVN